jgi:cell division protein FtsI (penicillin-binding protein 3)
VVIHKPDKKIGYYGNIVAAPVFKQIAHKIYSDTPVQDEVAVASQITEVNKDYDNYYSKANSTYKTVPDVKDMPGMDAISLLENLGLIVNFKGVGKVKKQSIKAGNALKQGEIITLELT